MNRYDASVSSVSKIINMKNIIIDTGKYLPFKLLLHTKANILDPGVDDALALLYALSLPAEFRVLLVSLTFGNVSLKQCFRNAYAILDIARKHVLHGPGAAEGDVERIPLSLGETSPLLAGETVDAAHFHGGDGLGGIHSSDSHATPDDWEDIFRNVTNSIGAVTEGKPTLPFKMLSRSAHEEILDVLKTQEPQSVTIVAIGPLSNIAKAAIADPAIFSLVKEIVIMGGAVDVAGNANPFAEFNILADPEAAAITFALTNPQLSTAIPTTLPGLNVSAFRQLASPVKVTLVPLDITRQHYFSEDEWEDACQGTELADWIHKVCASSFRAVPGNSTTEPTQSNALVPHDALCLWYVLNADEADANNSLFQRVVMDLRVETRGEWTKGMCCVDRRLKTIIPVSTTAVSPSIDPGMWMDSSLSNCVGVLKETPGRMEWLKAFTQALLCTDND